MSVLSYKKLFKLELLHDFYANGNCPDFTVVPSAETVALFSKLKIRTVNTDNGLLALYEDRNGTPFSPITEEDEAKFSFGLQLKTPSFTNYTDLLTKSATADKYYYTYDPEPDPVVGKYTVETIPVYSNLINYEFSLNGVDSGDGDPVTVVVKKGIEEVFSIEVESYDHSADTYYYRAQLDLRNPESGIHVIFRETGSGNVFLKKILVDSSLSSSQIFAIVDIFKTDNLYDEHEIKFTSKQVQWKYFLVLKNGTNNMSQYVVEDTKPSPIEFDLTPPEPADDIVINSIKQQYPNAEIKIYLSDDPELIPFSETPRKGIALKKDIVEMMPNLPNPNPRAAKPEIFVYVDN